MSDKDNNIIELDFRKKNNTSVQPIFGREEEFSGDIQCPHCNSWLIITLTNSGVTLQQGYED
jgi:hypothetical protein